MMTISPSPTQPRGHRWIDCGLLLLLAVSYFMLNRTLPYLLDDFSFGYVCLTDHNYDYDRPIVSLGDLLDAQQASYMVSNGRVIITGLSQILCALGDKVYADVLAGLLFIPFVLLIGALCLPDRPLTRVVLPACALTFVFWLTNTAQSNYYSGAVFMMNYTYGTVINLMCIYLLTVRTSVSGVWLCLVAFLAGLSQEVYAIGTGAWLVTWLWQHRRTADRAHVLAVACFCVGAALLVFAPANLLKQDNSSYSALSKYYVLPYLALFIGGAALLWHRRPGERTAFVRDNLPLMAAWGLSLLFLFYLGLKEVKIYGRMMIGVQTFGFILLIRWGRCCFADALGPARRWARPAAVALSCLFVAFLWLTIALQRPEADAVRRLYALCEDPAVTEVHFDYPNVQTPRLLKRYVYYYMPSPFWDEQFALRYRKPVVIEYHKDGRHFVNGVPQQP